MDELDYDKMLQGIMSLKNNGDFLEFVAWLKAIVMYQDYQWADAKDEVTLRQMQGKQQALRSIIATIDQASEIISSRKLAAEQGKNPNI